jgi:hypothetical protein
MNAFIKSNGITMTAWIYGKPVLAWNRETQQVVNPYDHKPIAHATMLEFTTLIEKGEK